jgi:lipoate-protein ligase A
MIYSETNSHDPTWNLAFEEYCLLELTQFEKIMLLWQNDNAIIVGRFQNAEHEINIDAVKKIGAKVVKRSTGGGTVYHDLGNLNYSFIYPVNGLGDLDLAGVSVPMVHALNRIGVPAEIQGRNDIVIEGKKISGTAQRYHKGRFLHHGTLLFDSNLEQLQSVLNVDPTKIASKGVASVRSRVTNIKEHLPEGKFADIHAFWQALIAAFGEEEELTRYQLTEPMLAEIKKLQETKYQTWEWNFGNAPSFEYNNSQRFPGGKLEVHVNVNNGLIQQCKIAGDFLGLVSLDELENALVGVKYNAADVKFALEMLNLPMFLGSISADEFVQCVFAGIALQ